MMTEDGLTALASLFKDRDNKTPPSATTGIVIAPPPEPQIRLNDVVILYKENLIFAAGMLVDYVREADVEGAIKFTDTDAGTTTNVSSHSHGIETLNVDTTYEAKVKVTWKDTIVPGDEVILIPVIDGQLYYVLDKAVRFE